MGVIDMIRPVTYGERFKELRKRLGMEQDDLAERLYGSKKQQGNVAAIEGTRGRIPRAETILSHATALQCKVSDLIGPVDDTWLDRARRGEFDVGRPRPAARDGTLERKTAKR